MQGDRNAILRLSFSIVAMETFFAINRWIHIAAGFTGFFVAPVALAVRKGGVAHRGWGRVFFWAMP